MWPHSCRPGRNPPTFFENSIESAIYSFESSLSPMRLCEQFHSHVKLSITLKPPKTEERTEKKREKTRCGQLVNCRLVLIFCYISAFILLSDFCTTKFYNYSSWFPPIHAIWWANKEARSLAAAQELSQSLKIVPTGPDRTGFPVWPKKRCGNHVSSYNNMISRSL